MIYDETQHSAKKIYVYPISGDCMDALLKTDKDDDYPLKGFKETYKENAVSEYGQYNMDITRKSFKVIINGKEESIRVYIADYMETGAAVVYMKNMYTSEVYPAEDEFFQSLKSKRKTSVGYIKHYYEKAMDNMKTAEQNKLDDMMVQGKNFIPKISDVEDNAEEVEFELNSNDSLQDRFVEIVGTVSDIDKEINEQYTLESQRELAEGFLKAKEALTSRVGEKPGTFIGLFDKVAGGNKHYKKIRKNMGEAISKNDSVQDNINYLFGVMSNQYDKMVIMCEKLQQSKKLAEAQLIALTSLSKESNEKISVYKNQSDIPMRQLMTDTQIKASMETYRTKIVNLEGTIVATQTSIMVLGRDLPSLRTNMTGDSAVNSILSSAGDFQEMCKEISTLGSNLARTTEEKIYTVTKNLIQMQIDDTHTMMYLADSAERSQEMVTMVKSKSTELAQKVTRDANFMSDIISGKDILAARKKHKLLK